MEISDMDKKRVMIVDDAAMMRLVIQNMLHGDPYLKMAGFAVNGREALDKLAEVNPDLILLDIEMPEMDGLWYLPRWLLQVLSRRCKRSPWGPMPSSPSRRARFHTTSRKNGAASSGRRSIGC
jgi:response regulator RpfG family c-di-GMP phosphodiesterase